MIENLAGDLGFTQYLRRKPQELSQGFRQRVAIAEALLGQPELLIMDEPTLGLDPESLVAIRSKLMSMRQEGKTILLSSHNLGLIEQIGGYYVFVKEGEVRGEGFASEFEAAGGTNDSMIETKGIPGETGSLIAGAYPEAKISGSTIAIPGKYMDKGQFLADLLRWGVSITALSPSKSRLEQTFLKLCGESRIREW